VAARGNAALATHFRRVSIVRGTAASGAEMWIVCGARKDGSGQMMLGAPTLSELEATWVEVMGSEFEARHAQHVVGVHFRSGDVEEVVRVATARRGT
jgi:hypothetical protein